MFSLGRFRRVAREWVAAALGLTALAVPALVYFHEYGPTRYSLSISAGDPDGLRQQIALHLKAAAAKQQVFIEIVPTRGSEHALELIESGQLKLALVQGGLETQNRANIRQVASLKIEPLHLVVKSEIDAPKTEETQGLDFLRGKTVNLGAVGSGTNELSREVLKFAGLKAGSEEEPGDFTPVTLTYSQLLDEKDRSRLPDAAFMVSALPSPVARYLIGRDYRIVPLRFGDAFALDSTHNSPAISVRKAGDKADRNRAFGVDRIHVYNTEIPAYTYRLSPPMPEHPVSTFGTRLLLVARADADTEAIVQLLKAAYAVGPGGAVLDPALADLPPEIDWHDGTLAYRNRIKPLFFGDAVDFMEKGTSLLGAILGGSFFLWQWYRQRVRRRRDIGFESYILKVAEVERCALQYELGAKLDLKELIRLQAELSHLKSEALQRFARGELEGEELLSGFVTHVNDARNYLTRLILHQRENLEQEAIAQRRAPEVVWNEEIGNQGKNRGSSGLVDLGRDFDGRTAAKISDE